MSRDFVLNWIFRTKDSAHHTVGDQPPDAEQLTRLRPSRGHPKAGLWTPLAPGGKTSMVTGLQVSVWPRS